ncbi:hypothetical protein MY04_0861 [Flammeovirga sp. MY04]|uniref:caspase family protein n=1 Tax=Flammeovirga sp. MY04 TaxID=1191459 RepID=UPI001305375A|nr:caspase family protein [Flammeovirga sp. MY04]ANQ48243.2 hypothetical protein MY04_0861 [Flammeovirga sp. MY04]
MKISFYSICLFVLLFHSVIGQDKSQHVVMDPQGHSQIIRKVVFSSNNQKIYSVSEDRTMRVWDVPSSSISHTFWGNMSQGVDGGYGALTLSPDNKLIAVAGELKDHEISIINLTTGEQIASLLGHESSVSDLQFSSDGEYLVSAGADNTVRVWYIPFLENEVFEEEPYEELSIEEHTDLVYNIDLSEDGSRLVTSSFDGTVRMYSMSVGMKSAALMKVWETSDRFTNVEISVDNKFVVAGDDHGRVYVWNTNGTEVASLTDTEGFITSLDFSDNDELLLVTDSKGNIVLYDTEAWVKHKSLDNKKGIVSSAQFANLSKNYILTAIGDHPEINIWDISKNKIVRTFKSDTKSFHDVTVSGSEVYLSKGNQRMMIDFEGMKVDLNAKNTASGTTIEKDNLSLKDEYTIQYNDVRIDADDEIVTFGKLPSQIVISTKSSLKLYDLLGEEQLELMGCLGTVDELYYLNNNKYLMGKSADFTYHIWNLATGEHLVSAYISDNNDWIIWSPKGYYEASAGGEQYVGFLVSHGFGVLGEFNKLSSLSNRFHRLQILKKIYQSGGFKEANISNHQPIDIAEIKPKVEWASPLSEDEIIDDAVQVTATVRSKLPLSSLRLMLNARPYPQIQIDESLEEGVYTYKIDQKINVPFHFGSIQLFIENKEISYLTNPRHVSTEDVNDSYSLDDLLKQTSVKDKKDIHVVSIGISEFSNNALNLKYADKDAMSLADAFLGQQRGELFNEVKLKRLTNSDATKENILQSINDLKTEVTSKDMTVIYISTHGLEYKNQLHLTPYDVNLNTFSTSALKWAELEESIAQLPSQVIVFFDVQKGRDLGSQLKATQLVEEVRQLSSDKNNISVFASNNMGEVPLNDENNGHSLFVEVLLEGLGKGLADNTGDHFISLKELAQFVCDQVQERSEDQQHPIIVIPTAAPNILIGNLKSN